MHSSGGAAADNWTETVEDLVHGGEIGKAVSFLESTVSNFESELGNEEPLQITNGGRSVDRLCAALQDLSKLYAAQGFSVRADQARSRAFQIKHKKRGFFDEKESTLEARVSQNGASTSDGVTKHGCNENSSRSQADGIPQDSGEDDDWEAIADRAPEELLSLNSLPEISKLSLEDSKSSQGTKRRGRGTFYYKKQGLYSDDQSSEPVIDESEDKSVGHVEDVGKGKLIYGTRHVLVLADIPPSTRTIDIERLLKKLLENFKDLFVIRWVNDTSALAVFKTPSIALEVSKSIQCPFTVHVLNEDDEILRSVSPKDLEPPRPRPQTSASTARRMIAHSMGIKLPSTFGSTDQLRKQEAARRNRIVTRQNMRDDAWGGDDAK